MKRRIVQLLPIDHEWLVQRAKELDINIQDIADSVFEQARNDRYSLNENNVIKSKLASELHKLNMKKQAIEEEEERLRKQLQSHMRTINMSKPTHVIESGDFGGKSNEQLSLDRSLKGRI